MMDFSNLNENEKQAFSEIHAHVCGDGNLTTYLQNKSPSSVRNSRTNKPFRWFKVEYTNNEMRLLKEFEKNIRILLGRDQYVYVGGGRLQVRRKSLYLFLKEHGAGKSREWKIPKIISNSAILSKIWLRAFFDDEATVENSKDHKRIRIKSVNKKGLRQVLWMIKKFEIDANITGPNSDNTWYLTVKDFKKYFRLIGFDHPIKSKNLQKMVNMR